MYNLQKSAESETHQHFKLSMRISSFSTRKMGMMRVVPVFRCLTEEVFNQLENVVTSSGFTLDACIQTGVDNPGHPFIFTVGAVAGR